MIATIETISKWINEVSNKKSHYKQKVAEELDISNSAKEIVIQKATYEVLSESLEITYSHDDNLTKATPQIKELLAGIKENYEGILYAAYEMPEDMRLEATAKVKTVNKLLRML